MERIVASFGSVFIWVGTWCVCIRGRVSVRVATDIRDGYPLGCCCITRAGGTEEAAPLPEPSALLLLLRRRRRSSLYAEPAPASAPALSAGTKSI